MDGPSGRPLGNWYDQYRNLVIIKKESLSRFLAWFLDYNSTLLQGVSDDALCR